MHDRLIGEVRKSARESIRVILREKRGDVGLDLRIAVTNGRGGLTETAKGIRIPLAQVGDVISALQEAQRLAGPLDP
ncbi:hypothetical protein MKK55_10170 [Methylobacterium sp. J-059]|uniref:hypothetical protein n=1 Tax=Methylobacterium sp. J-059 TaxID=2836643 RepID=UPI001FBA7C8D|nr:hypothetical protein [Methylobacterium sp. J-059]MCJ2039301.1 hypothetical protein [Methylobacterium sp. J-059]